MKAKFEVVILEPAKIFLGNLPEKEREKVIHNIDKARFVTDARFFNKQIRFFAFWDTKNNKKTLVISTHGMIKKSNKIPKKEIRKAEKMRVQYFKEGNDENEA
jgi:phage-related protein